MTERIRYIDPWGGRVPPSPRVQEIIDAAHAAQRQAREVQARSKELQRRASATYDAGIYLAQRLEATRFELHVERAAFAVLAVAFCVLLALYLGGL